MTAEAPSAAPAAGGGEEGELTPPSAWERWPGAAALVALAAVAYLPAYGAGFVWRDDWSVPAAPPAWGTDRPWGVWSEVAGPLTHLALRAQVHLWGGEPPGYHVVSVGLHAVAVVLLWTLLRRLSVPAAWAAAALFAVHPAQAVTVAWVSRQGMLWSAVFALAALLCFLRWAGVTPAPEAWEEPGFRLRLRMPRRPAFLYGLTLALAAAAVAFHPAAAGWPLAAAAFVWWRRGRLTGAEAAALAPIGLIAALAAGAALLGPGAAPVAGGEGSAWPDDGPLPLTARLAAAGPNVFLGLAKAAVPLPAVVNAEFGGAALPPWIGWTALAAAAAVPAVAWTCRRRLGLTAAFAAATYFGCGLLAAALDATDLGGEVALLGQSNYLLAAIPIALFTAGLRRQAAAVGPASHARRAARLLARSAVPAGCAAATLLVVAPRYRDESSFWAGRVSDRAGDGLAERELGAAAFRDPARLVAASEHFRTALRLNPNDGRAATGLGRALGRLGRPGEGVQVLEDLLRRGPGDARLLHDLARTEASAGQPDSAARHFAAAVAARPDDPAIRTDYGRLLAGRGDDQGAAEQLQAVVAAHPEYAPARIGLAALRFRQGRLAEAGEQLQAAARADPRNFDAYMASGATLAEVRAFPAAERMFRSAVVLRRDSREAWSGLAHALEEQGRSAEASWANEQARRCR